MTNEGIVKFFKNGFGFVIPIDGSSEIFVHINDVVDNRTLTANQVVSYEVMTQSDGRTRACNVQLLST